jgi:predicted metal-dependent hydrolase
LNEILDREISAFIGQEAMHSKEHHAFHVSAQQYGSRPTVTSKFHFLLKTFSIAFKTMPVTFSKDWGSNQLMTDSTIRNLWLWHSIEETEHKAVAFDLYQHLYGTYAKIWKLRVDDPVS